MSHSFTSNFIHFVFSTKLRRNLIPESMLTRTWEYLSGVARNHDIQPLIAGGTRDHIHFLAILPVDWQEGYGAFSVSSPHAGRVAEYIRNQAEHHRKRSFEEEFAVMLKQCGVNYDPEKRWYRPVEGLAFPFQSMFEAFQDGNHHRDAEF